MLKANDWIALVGVDKNISGQVVHIDGVIKSVAKNRSFWLKNSLRDSEYKV